eukprot:scaffold17762_cov90-Skeletonema_marinoi.AAC.1
MRCGSGFLLAAWRVGWRWRLVGSVTSWCRTPLKYFAEVMRLETDCECSQLAASPTPTLHTEGGEEESLYITAHEIVSLTMESNKHCCLLHET